MPNKSREFKRTKNYNVSSPHPPCEIGHGITHSHPIQFLIKNCCISLMVTYTVRNRWHTYKLLTSQYTVCDHWDTTQHIFYYGTIPLIMQIFRLQLNCTHCASKASTNKYKRQYLRFLALNIHNVTYLHYDTSLVAEYQPDINMK